MNWPSFVFGYVAGIIAVLVFVQARRYFLGRLSVSKGG